MDLQDYDYALDMWSLGCMFAGMIFRKEPFFNGHDNYDQLVRIAKVLGTDELYAYLSKYSHRAGSAPGEPHRAPQPQAVEQIRQRRQPAPRELGGDRLPGQAARYDHQERLTSREAQDEPYFAPVKQAAERSVATRRRGGGADGAVGASRGWGEGDERERRFRARFRGFLSCARLRSAASGTTRGTGTAARSAETALREPVVAAMRSY